MIYFLKYPYLVARIEKINRKPKNWAKEHTGIFYVFSVPLALIFIFPCRALGEIILEIPLSSPKKRKKKSNYCKSKKGHVCTPSRFLKSVRLFVAKLHRYLLLATAEDWVWKSNIGIERGLEAAWRNGTGIFLDHFLWRFWLLSCIAPKGREWLLSWCPDRQWQRHITEFVWLI